MFWWILDILLDGDWRTLLLLASLIATFIIFLLA
jgi:hypothetical protein